MNAKQLKKIHIWIRAIIQLLYFIFIPSVYTAAFAGVKYIFTQIGAGEKVALTSFVTVLIVVCIYTAVFGRFFCGFACAFGSLGDGVNALYRLICKKMKKKPVQIPDRIADRLVYLKYVILLVMVVLLPAIAVNDVGMGDPFFCKYLCPQGVLEGAIPLALVNSGIRAALGKLFTWKLCILLAVAVLSVLFYRPFCKWLCPLGAFYALFNKVSLLRMKVDANACISCGKCARACSMDVDVTKTPDHAECIRCGKCVLACPTGAVHFRYGFGDGPETKGTITAETKMEESN